MPCTRCSRVLPRWKHRCSKEASRDKRSAMTILWKIIILIVTMKSGIIIEKNEEVTIVMILVKNFWMEEAKEQHRIISQRFRDMKKASNLHNLLTTAIIAESTPRTTSLTFRKAIGQCSQSRTHLTSSVPRNNILSKDRSLCTHFKHSCSAWLFITCYKIRTLWPFFKMWSTSCLLSVATYFRPCSWSVT